MKKMYSSAWSIIQLDQHQPEVLNQMVMKKKSKQNLANSLDFLIFISPTCEIYGARVSV